MRSITNELCRVRLVLCPIAFAAAAFGFWDGQTDLGWELLLLAVLNAALLPIGYRRRAAALRRQATQSP